MLLRSCYSCDWHKKGAHQDEGLPLGHCRSHLIPAGTVFLEQHVQVLVAAVGAVLQGLQRESSGAMAKSLQLLKDWYLLVQPSLERQKFFPSALGAKVGWMTTSRSWR